MMQLPMFDPVILVLDDENFALIDPQDSDLCQFKWSSDRGYVRRLTQTSGKKKKIYLHRVILERIIGRELGRWEYVDHRDGNPSNNQRHNLRVATPTQNAQNARRKAYNAPHKGIMFVPRVKRWRVKFMAQRKIIEIGYFDTPEEAYKAYMEAIKEYHGEFAHP